MTKPLGIFGALCFTAYAASGSPATELVTGYCLSCHNEKLKTAGLLLDHAHAEHVSNAPGIWE